MSRGSPIEYESILESKPLNLSAPAAKQYGRGYAGVTPEGRGAMGQVKLPAPVKPAGMTPPAAPAAAPSAAPVAPSAANGNLVVAAASDTTPYTMDQRQEMAINKGINMELARNRRRESDALASANGYDVTYDEDGTRRLTPISNATSGRGMTSGTPDNGIGGNVYQRQLENMQNMRMRSDMMDFQDFLRRRVETGPTSIGDLPAYRGAEAMLKQTMEQAGPGGTMERTNAAVAGRLAEADVTGRYGMEGQRLQNVGAMEREQLQSSDRRYVSDTDARTAAAKLAQEGQLALPKFGLEAARLQYLQDSGLTPEAFAAIEGKFQGPEFQFLQNEAGQVVAGNKRTGEALLGGVGAQSNPQAVAAAVLSLPPDQQLAAISQLPPEQKAAIMQMISSTR